MTVRATAGAGGVNDSTQVSQPTSGTRFADYAEYVAQILLASETGSVATIPNPLATGSDPTVLRSPEQIHAFRKSIADQMNAQSSGPTFLDLSERIADVVIETTAQGADTLTLSIIDPFWIIPMSGFITVDETGYLWPPIDINFPSDTDCMWRLCQYAPSWGTASQANLTLTFEDKIVSELRNISAANGGVQQGAANQTLGGFFKMLIDSANNTLHTRMRIVELISPKDPNYVVPITELPKSSEGKLRTNPNKTNLGITAEGTQVLSAADLQLESMFPSKNIETTLQHLEEIASGGTFRKHKAPGGELGGPLRIN